MAKCGQPLTFRWLWPGLLACGLFISGSMAPLGALIRYAPDSHWAVIWHDAYLWHLVKFTFWQALLSTLFSVLPAILLARALWRRRFYGHQLLLRLFAMTMVLPVLIVLFGLLRVYGHKGWLAQLCQILGVNYTFHPYGLKGILLAHVFFNLPLASRLLLQALKNITIEQRQVALQLGMNDWQHFRFVEWPLVRRQILQVSALIFILCFTSFTTLLVLGGGPRATTIELAIWQALSYEYNLARAALLALIQLICCLSIALFCQHLNKLVPPGNARQRDWSNPVTTRWQRMSDVVVISAALLLLLPPLLAVVIAGINPQLLETLQQPRLWQAMGTSLMMALASGLFAVVLTVMLLWSSRELTLRQYLRWGQAFEISGMLILAVPGMVLASGFFLLLQGNLQGLLPYVLVVFINTLMVVPYILKILHSPMQDIAGRYTPLCLSLNIYGLHRLRWIELRALQHPLTQALALGCALSLGDLGVIMLLGNEDCLTLPLYLYQQIAAYRSNEGAVTALLLFLLCILLFTLIERLSEHYADT